MEIDPRIQIVLGALKPWEDSRLTQKTAAEVLAALDAAEDTELNRLCDERLARGETPIREEARKVRAASFAPGSLGCHEALHMASVFADMVARNLAEHPTVLSNPAWEALADRAVDALGDLYQAIGQEHHLEKENDKI